MNAPDNTRSIEAMANLLQMLRVNTPGSQISATGVEAFLRLASGPKTAAELMTATGSANGPLIRQLHRFCTVYDAKANCVKVPALKLISRTPREGKLQGHLYSLTQEGREFLRIAGLCDE